MENITCIAHNYIEFTLLDPLTDHEAMVLIDLADANDVDATVVKSGRIVVFDVSHVEEATPFMAEMELIENIGLIKHITSYEIMHDDNKIMVEFE